MTLTESHPRFLLCVKNEGFPGSLEVRTVYQAVPDVGAVERGYVRVFDELGEDYLYPEEFFVPIDLPQAAARAKARAA